MAPCPKSANSGFPGRAKRAGLRVEMWASAVERPPIPGRLLTLMAFDFFLDFSFYRIKVESRGCLHWRIVDSRFRQFGYLLLNQHKAPELATKEVVHVTTTHVIHALTADRWRPLERVLADVDYGGHIGGGFLSRPPVWLLEELKLEVIQAQGSEMRTCKIQELMPNGRSLARQKGRLVVTIEMVLIGTAFQRHAVEKLVGNVRVSRCGGERRQPVEA